MAKKKEVKQDEVKTVEAVETPVAEQLEPNQVELDVMKQKAVEAYKANGKTAEAVEAVIELLNEVPLNYCISLKTPQTLKDRTASESLFKKVGADVWTKTYAFSDGSKIFDGIIPTVSVSKIVVDYAIATYWD